MALKELFMVLGPMLTPAVVLAGYWANKSRTVSMVSIALGLVVLLMAIFAVIL